MDKDIKIRKLKKNINIYGKAMLAFSVWGVVKYIIMSILGNANSDSETDASDWTINIAVILIYFLIGLYIAFAAMRYVKSKRRYKLLVTFAIIYILIVFISIAVSIILIIISDNIYNIDTIIVSLITDATMCYIMIDMVISVFRLNRLFKADANRVN